MIKREYNLSSNHQPMPFIFRIYIAFFFILGAIFGYGMCTLEIRAKADCIPQARVQIEAEKEESIEPQMVSLGPFRVTAYTASADECGKSDGITASGTHVTAGRTIAADWRILPPGTKVYIEDVGIRTVEDRGGAIDGSRIDLYIEDKQDAINYGVQWKNVYVLPE
ncbi:MAG: 3D domain-containing protein [Bacillota bacterium]|nr:3D domain-containing protein [Bacillota bacterium]